MGNNQSTKNAGIVATVATSTLLVGYAIGNYMAKKNMWNFEPKICDTILDHVGNTPLVRLQRVGKNKELDGEGAEECEILCKCEFFNAGGSVKDRIGRRMVMDAEKSGRIQKGDTLIEPTSGNTGIGLALSAAVLGYKMVITLPKKMSDEKVNVLKALGAIVKRTPTDAPCPVDRPGHVYSHIYKAQKIRDEVNEYAKKTEGSTRDVAHILDQYSNKSNPLAHIEGTAQEILRQCDGKLDMIVATAGTGGTLAGLAYALKKVLPDLIVVGVDPHGSDLAVPGVGKIENASTTHKVVSDSNKSSPQLTKYKVEGIGYDFLPDVLTFKNKVRDVNPREDLVDKWYKTSDKDSFIMSRRLIREEGLLCGGSCGSAVIGALQAVKDFKLGKGKRVVVILADSTRNYMTKFLKDEWMEKYNFADKCYKPQLENRSDELSNLSCEESWKEQAEREPENMRDLEKSFLVKKA